MTTIEVKFFRRELKLKLDISIFQTEEENININSIYEENKSVLIEIKHPNPNTYLDFRESKDIKVLYLNTHNVIVGEISLLDDFEEFKILTESKRILLIPLEKYIRMEMKSKRNLLDEYRKTLDTVLDIENRGIRSWATSMGYAITVGKLNRIGYDLGYERWIDIRDRNNT